MNWKWWILKVTEYIFQNSEKKPRGEGVPSTPPPSNPLHVLDSHKKVYTYVSSPALTFARKAREGAGWGVGNSPREYFRNFEKALFI